THPVDGERMPWHDLLGRTVDVLHRRPARDRPHARGLEVGAGVGSEDARHPGGFGRVDAADDGMSVRRADEDGVSLAGKRNIVGILAGAAHEPLVLGAAHGLADAELTHYITLRIAFGAPSARS